MPVLMTTMSNKATAPSSEHISIPKSVKFCETLRFRYPLDDADVSVSSSRGVCGEAESYESISWYVRLWCVRLALEEFLLGGWLFICCMSHRPWSVPYESLSS